MNTKIVKWVSLASLLLLGLTACTDGGNANRTVIKESNGESITIIEDNEEATGDPDVSIEEIKPFPGLDVSDWLDEDTVIVSKENKSLDKMTLAELSDEYPKSLYSYSLETEEFKLMKEQKNTFLGDARLSPDKKYLLYSSYSLGDPLYYVMNLDTKETFALQGEPIGGAMSAKWVDSQTIIGAAYSGGAYIATVDGKIAVLDGLTEGALYIVRKVGSNVYYNTNSDPSLMRLDLDTKQTESMNLEQVYELLPSPEGNQLLIAHYNGTESSLILSEMDGSNQQVIAEASELSGLSWSPDQRMIAYHMKSDGAAAGGLYVFDLLTSESMQIATGVENATTFWSPSGNALLYKEWDGEQLNSSIVTFNDSSAS
ncbi:DUF5050 domain-containing protein [Paenibacillus sp. HB172176]|uniref:TolB family protein n=1 Tax=Paenibacillus sp. HB172176 TaxID=2493690 RepID=UPI00143A0637|nr:DUF5050 domain-containing protein [Paenibacillus sp. HB172176]